MNSILHKLLRHELLTFSEARQLIFSIEEEAFPSERISGMLMIIQMRGAQLEEMRGFRSALIELSRAIELDSEHAIDLCGTGGDGKNTFNISTTTAFVLASMGKKVIKHGNYGVSSLCGSSNVLEELGIVFTSDEGELQRQLDQQNICFLHAPLFHPTMKKVAPIRKSLGVQTIFNNLGPLINPAQPKFQLTGTYSLELARMYQHILRTERTNYRVVYGMDGFDEVSLTDDTRVFGDLTDTVVNAHTFGTDPLQLPSIKGGNSIREAAEIMRSILDGRGTHAQTSVVAANTALALQLYHPSASLDELYTEAFDFIQTGKARLSASPSTTMYL